MRNMSHDPFNKAIASLEKGRRSEAKRLFSKILRTQPNHLDANYLLGTLCAEDGEIDKGKQLLRKALKMKPDSPYILNNLGNVYKEQSKYKDALSCYESAVEINPELTQAHCNIGVVLTMTGDFEGARKHFEIAGTLQPGMNEARAGLASLQEHAGNYRKARKSMEKAISSGARDIHTVLAFAQAVLHDDSSPSELQRVLQLVGGLVSLDDAPGISRIEQAKVYYMLGALNDRLKDYEQAFRCYETANKMSFSRYDIKKLCKSIGETKEVFTRKVMNRSAHEAGANLVFMVGMLRSGSTLVEQILDSHPEVASLGETDNFVKAMDTVKEKPPDFLLPEQQIDQIAGQYRNYCLEQHPNAKVFTDKTLPNFLRLGQIRQVFPQAKIIHCQRDPLDTCLSCYFHNFSGRFEYTNDLVTLGQYFRAYQDLMGHWKEVLGDRLYALVYEDLIDAPKDEIKQLLHFCVTSQ